MKSSFFALWRALARVYAVVYLFFKYFIFVFSREKNIEKKNKKNTDPSTEYNSRGGQGL